LKAGAPRQQSIPAGAFNVVELQRCLASLIGPLRGAALCVAYSGGADSTALLAALAQLRRRCGFSLRAVHVNHQLHVDAAQWAELARATAVRLTVPVQLLSVTITPAGLSLEAAAREARYGALAAALNAGEYLLTAHHQEDQLETILLQLMRGAGVAGLAAMPARAPFARGWLLRPLLAQSRANLHAWLRQQDLPWLEDPANVDQRFDRNYLRAEIVPRLQARWPAAARTAARSARHLAEAQQQLTSAASAQLELAADGLALRATALRALPAALRRSLLRHWLTGRGVALPDTAALTAALAAMLETRADANPVASWPGGGLRRHGDRILALQAVPSGAPRAGPAAPSAAVWHWRRAEGIALPGSGHLRLEPHPAGAVALDRLPGRLQIRFRSGGERLELPFGHKALKNLLQELDIPPWQRARLPLVQSGGKLLAVADCWLHPSLRATSRTRRRAHLRFAPEN
jgi:tRNA(Ile)-lysidine synthase